jgi:hypothetical protein
MFGQGVGDDESYLALLSQSLNQSAPEGYHWEIINTAVPGYNTVMEVATFREKGLRYTPDLVIVGYIGNDLNLPNFLHREDHYFSLRRSFVAEFVLVRLRRLKLTSPSGLVAASPDVIDDAFEAEDSRVLPQYRGLVGLEAYRTAMAELKALSLTHGFDALVFANNPADNVRNVLRDLALPLLDTKDGIATYMSEHGLSEYGGPPLMLSKRDAHPSALGHAVRSQILYSYLHDSGLLSRIFERRGISSATLR